MSDDVTYEPGFGGTQQPRGEPLREAIAELSETIREIARRSAALDARIDAMPGAMEIASAVESEVEHSVREARDVIDARVGSLGAELESLSQRLAEVSDALVPLEGLRTEIATVADESASFRDTRSLLQSALEQLSGGHLPTVAGDTIGAEVDARLDQFRRVLEETATTIRSDFELLVGAEQEASERRNDALGLRITNMSVGVTATLDYLTAQAERMGERARQIEAENAAILQAIRQEIASADGGTARAEAADDTGPKVLSALRELVDRIDTIESRVAEGPDRGDGTGVLVLDAVRELAAHVATIEARISQGPDPSAGTDALVLDAVRELATKVTTIEARVSDGLASLETKAAERSAPAVVGDLNVPELARIEPALEDVRARLAELARVEPALNEVADQLAALAHGDPTLEEVRARLSEIARVEPALDALMAQLTDLARVEPALADVREQLRELARLQPNKADSDASAALISSTVEQLRATLDEAIGAMRESLAQPFGELSARLDSVEAAVARAVADTSDALDGAAAQSAGGMQDVRAALAQLTESASGIERIRQELFQAMESFSTQLVTRTAGVKTSITERAGRLEDQIAALPGRDALAEAVLKRLAPGMADAARQGEEKIAGMEQDIGGVASNVNEIWIRVRSIAKSLEEEREAAREDTAQAAERIEELTRGEARLAARVNEAERRLVESMRAIETERDRVFLETLGDLLEKMPRRERKLFRKRVREIPLRRGEPEPRVSPAPQSSEPPIRRFAGPTETARAPQPARAKAKPKPKPRARAPKPKPAPQAKSAPQTMPAPQPKPAKAKAKPKPKPKPAPRTAKPAPEEKSSAAPKPAPMEPPARQIEPTEAGAVVDTHAPAAPDETPKEAPAPSEGQEAAEGPSGTDSGV